MIAFLIEHRRSCHISQRVLSLPLMSVLLWGCTRKERQRITRFCTCYSVGELRKGLLRSAEAFGCFACSAGEWGTWKVLARSQPSPSRSDGTGSCLVKIFHSVLSKVGWRLLVTWLGLGPGSRFGPHGPPWQAFMPSASEVNIGSKPTNKIVFPRNFGLGPRKSLVSFLILLICFYGAPGGSVG